MFTRPDCFILLVLLATFRAAGATYENKPDDARFAKFKPLEAPRETRPVFKRGDRLAICGDSITEQKMYSRIIEDYLTVCVPELEITTRQFGWSGERAPGFLARMTNDCLRFHPTVATTCYGMNDHEYRPYEHSIGRTYRSNTVAILEAFRANRARVVLGSPGCVGKMPSWVKSASGTVEDLNLNLCELRNIDIEIAQKEKTPFADIFWPMFTAGFEAQKRYGPDFAIAGKDGVHPGWAGQTVMAYAFLKSFGLKGEIGALLLDLKSGRLRTSSGHQLVSGQGGEFQLRSFRYPFCACVKPDEAVAGYPVCDPADTTKDSTIRAALTLIPFDQDLNRLTLVCRNGSAERYKVTWGAESRTFSRDQLAAGVNLAAEFPYNPFCSAFGAVDKAVAAKQAFETRQIKETFRSAEARADMESVAARTEVEHRALSEAVKTAFVPVTHTIRIVPD